MEIKTAMYWHIVPVVKLAWNRQNNGKNVTAMAAN